MGLQDLPLPWKLSSKRQLIALLQVPGRAARVCNRKALISPEMAEKDVMSLSFSLRLATSLIRDLNPIMMSQPFQVHLLIGLKQSL